MKPIALGSDDAGASLRHRIAEHLRQTGADFCDYGIDDTSSAYPSIAVKVARLVAGGIHDRAILCCGTGIGVAIAANKVPGVYAALCHDTYSAERARKGNNAQVLTLGARVIGPELALKIVDTWLASEFDADRSGAKVAELIELERSYLG